MTAHDRALLDAAERHVWPSMWLDWDPPDDPEGCAYCERLVCACMDEAPDLDALAAYLEHDDPL